MKIVSWNVNGLAACKRKGFLRFIADTKADVVCCQEIKTKCPLNTPGYLQFWNPAIRKGYAGTLILAKRLPQSVTTEMGIEQLDAEGRMIALEYKDYYIVNVYVPNVNTNSAPDRLEYRIEWDRAFREYLCRLQKPAILCGDFNVAHDFLDVYPENQRNLHDQQFPPVFVTDEREGFEQLLSLGLVDAFRALYPGKAEYTWWGPKNNNRKSNRGSRLDYFLVSGEVFPGVKNVKHHTNIVASDHCPISMLFTPVKIHHESTDEDYAAMWRIIDWPKMENELQQMQHNISYAAYMRNWDGVERLQKKLVNSWAAKVMAVRTVANTNSEAGIDGIRWTTDAQKMRAALSLNPNPRGYHPLPYRHQEIFENGKWRTIHIPAARDKAMMVLYAYSLDPVSEATADRKSFSARKGRSALDAHAYIVKALEGDDAPTWIIKLDILSYYGSIIHNILIKTIPMDTEMLKRFLQAGVIEHGELFPTNQGISLGTSLSPILGNMLLDGLQSFLQDHLYPTGNVDYADGNMVRFADDILVFARSRIRAEQVMQLLDEFLAMRGLRINPEKSYIVNVQQGFDFLSRHYQKKSGVLRVSPSDNSIAKFEHELENLILHFKGTQRELIEKINRKLTGWAGYHRVTDCYMVFRHIDAIVEGLLIRRMRDKYPRWKKKTILDKFWVKEAGGAPVFALPDNPSIRVIRLAPLNIVRHKPCKTRFNPYLDQDYYAWLQNRRDVQKASGKYRAIWIRQDGKCAYCGNTMLADQEVEVIERNIGHGRKTQNLIYIHRQCAYDIFEGGENGVEHLDLFEILKDVVDNDSEMPALSSPYLELTAFFHQCNQTPISLKFKEIEKIIGDSLDWEAYFYQSFWLDNTPERSSDMWKFEEFPFHTFLPSRTDYCIADSWLSQGYAIKALHLESEYVVFRKTVPDVSAIGIPKALLQKKVPDKAVHETKEFFAYLIKKYGLNA